VLQDVTASEADGNKPEVELDPSQVQVDLPSKFVFYPFSSLSVKPIKGVHQAKFARSAKEKSSRHMADAISTLLPGHISAYDLTLPDYYWLLYFLRLTFYPKSKLIHTSVCTNPDHVLEVANKTKPQDSLLTVTTVSKSVIKDTVFDRVSAFEGFDPDGTLPSLKEAFQLKLSPTTVRDMVELETMYSEEENNPDFQETEYLADLAGFVQSVEGPRLSLAARIELVKEFSPEQVSLVEDYRDRVSNYGAEETIVVRCGECGAEIKTSVSISAHSFL
jgi:hypothetical protein